MQFLELVVTQIVSGCGSLQSIVAWTKRMWALKKHTCKIANVAKISQNKCGPPMRPFGIFMVYLWPRPPNVHHPTQCVARGQCSVWQCGPNLGQKNFTEHLSGLCNIGIIIWANDKALKLYKPGGMVQQNESNLIHFLNESVILLTFVKIRRK